MLDTRRSRGFLIIVVMAIVFAGGLALTSYSRRNTDQVAETFAHRTQAAFRGTTFASVEAIAPTVDDDKYSAFLRRPGQLPISFAREGDTYRAVYKVHGTLKDVKVTVVWSAAGLVVST